MVTNNILKCSLLAWILLFAPVRKSEAQNNIQPSEVTPIPPPPALRIVHGHAVDCSKGTACYGLSGKVRVHVVIGKDGRAASIIPLGGDKRFFDAVVNAVRLYRFKSCTEGRDECGYDFTVNP